MDGKMSQIDLIKILESHSKDFGKKFFFIREIASLLSLSSPAAAMLLMRAEKNGLVFRVKNLWVNNLNQPTLFEIALTLSSPSYLSLESALFYHQCLSQSPKGALSMVACGRPFKVKTPLGDIRYFHLREKLFFGFDSHRIAYPEKAWLDLIYMRGLRGRSRILFEDVYFDRLSEKKISRLALRFPPWVHDLSKKIIKNR
jgi:hypothetical protein